MNMRARKIAITGRGVMVGDTETPVGHTSLGKVVNSVGKQSRPMTMIFERPARVLKKNFGQKGRANKRKNRRERSMFLVKWKDRSYKEATWEYEEDINDDLKVSRFRIFQTPPSLDN